MDHQVLNIAVVLKANNPPSKQAFVNTKAFIKVCGIVDALTLMATDLE